MKNSWEGVSFWAPIITVDVYHLAVLRIRAAENKGINSINPHIGTSESRSDENEFDGTPNTEFIGIDGENKNGTSNALTMRINIVERCQETNSSTAFGYDDCIAGSFKYRTHTHLFLRKSRCKRISKKYYFSVLLMHMCGTIHKFDRRNSLGSRKK